MENFISVEELKEKLSQHEPLHLLDVRTLEEHQHFNIGGQLIPIQELAFRLNEIPTDKPIIVYCRSGQRSQMAVDMLAQVGIDAQNLLGGMIAWQQML
ncbi:rhodanese-like domain-containing protein [Candidatus Berkiella cookevillensis]|uniref:Putative adenylyltransferase/sulfurtransferase MoeZ n=1 Tax=Candidatus Berkiella cookevillensis TaxID=437022 RepID=A0A0Q9YA66_9GAMM|nr:rhodanese-like domain-containing protein [Candidatus Berkiella cookevillensis]MCS5707415.1 rhodanese-like domain-containing protein [Candidatus Berkiella cookevillensis]